MSAQNPEDRQALRAEIQAAIAAGRELGPEMDGHLADSALDRFTQEQAVRQRVAGVAAPRPAPVVAAPNRAGEILARSVSFLMCVGAIVALITFVPNLFWSYWWLLFFIGPLFGRMLWGGHRGYRGYRSAPPTSADLASHQEYEETKRQYKIAQLKARIKRMEAGQDDGD